jgi:hypothetical protein
MKNLVFSALVALLVLTSGAAFAQIVPPGPTTQQEPDLNNNNLPNPGNPTAVGTQPTSVMPETETGSGVDVDVDTGSKAEGLVDVDVTSTTDADTDASGVDETGSLDNDANDNALPGTASELPAVALLGLLALAAAFTVRFLRS